MVMRFIARQSNHFPLLFQMDDIGSDGTPLSPMSVEKVQKFCKYASSALLYDDVPTAVDNLEKALTLLKTGQHPG